MTSSSKEAMLAESTINIVRHQDDVHTRLAAVIEAIFPLPEEDYLAMGLEDYRTLMLKAQSKLIEGNFVSRVIISIKAALESYLATDRFLVQSNLYMRAARPGMPRHYEISIGIESLFMGLT